MQHAAMEARQRHDMWGRRSQPGQHRVIRHSCEHHRQLTLSSEGNAVLEAAAGPASSVNDLGVHCGAPVPETGASSTERTIVRAWSRDAMASSNAMHCHTIYGHMGSGKCVAAQQSQRRSRAYPRTCPTVCDRHGSTHGQPRQHTHRPIPWQVCTTPDPQLWQSQQTTLSAAMTVRAASTPVALKPRRAWRTATACPPRVACQASSQLPGTRQDAGAAMSSLVVARFLPT